MKNSLKLTFLTIAVSLSVAACGGKKSDGMSDSTKVDSSVKTKTDTSVKVDTAKPATDTSKMKTDTVTKTVTKSTEVKKTEVKKDKK